MMQILKYYLDQIRCISEEVNKYIQYALAHARSVPLFAIFGAAANVGQGEDASVLQPQVHRGAKRRRVADVETSVSAEPRRVLTVEFRMGAVNDEHRNLGSVPGGIENLGDDVLLTINRCTQRFP